MKKGQDDISDDSNSILPKTVEKNEHGLEKDPVRQRHLYLNKKNSKQVAGISNS